MTRQQYLFAASFLLLLPGSRIWAADAGGVTLRLSLHPDIQGISEDQAETEVESDQGATTTDDSVSETNATMSESLINLGAGYTFGFGLHVGASFWQSTQKVDFTVSGGNANDPDAGAEFKSTTKTTSTAFGPTVGYVHASGFSVLFTPFATVASKTEDSTEFSIAGMSGEDDEPEVTDDSKTSGYRLDLAYHFRLGKFAIGPELSYMVTTTKIDVKTTETDTSVFNGDVTTTTTHETGTSRYSRLVPMLGMTVIL